MTYAYELLVKMIEGAGLMSGQLHYKVDGVYGEVLHEGIIYAVDIKPIKRECVGDNRVFDGADSGCDLQGRGWD